MNYLCRHCHKEQKRIKLSNQDFGINIKPKLQIKIESRVPSLLGFYFFLSVPFHWRRKVLFRQLTGWLQSQCGSLRVLLLCSKTCIRILPPTWWAHHGSSQVYTQREAQELRWVEETQRALHT